MRQRHGFFGVLSLLGFLGLVALQGTALAATYQHSLYSMDYPGTWTVQQLNSVPDELWDMIPMDEIPGFLQGVIQNISPEKPILQLTGPAGAVVYVAVVEVPSIARSFVEEGLFEEATLDEGDGLPPGYLGHVAAIGSPGKEYVAGLMLEAPTSVFDQVDRDFEAMVASFAWQ